MNLSSFSCDICSSFIEFSIFTSENKRSHTRRDICILIGILKDVLINWTFKVTVKIGIWLGTSHKCCCLCVVVSHSPLWNFWSNCATSLCLHYLLFMINFIRRLPKTLVKVRQAVMALQLADHWIMDNFNGILDNFRSDMSQEVVSTTLSNFTLTVSTHLIKAR